MELEAQAAAAKRQENISRIVGVAIFALSVIFFFVAVIGGDGFSFVTATTAPSTEPASAPDPAPPRSRRFWRAAQSRRFRITQISQ